MGVDIDQWRQRIGMFKQPWKSVYRLDTLMLGRMSLFISVLLFTLLAAQCVEMNPGPGPHQPQATNKGGPDCSDRSRGRGTPQYDRSQRTLRSSRVAQG